MHLQEMGRPVMSPWDQAGFLVPSDVYDPSSSGSFGWDEGFGGFDGGDGGGECPVPLMLACYSKGCLTNRVEGRRRSGAEELARNDVGGTLSCWTNRVEGRRESGRRESCWY